jgi:hypothetical protein
MKLKRYLALAGAAMALCGLAASSASAEEMPDMALPANLTTCAFSHDEPLPWTVSPEKCVTITVTNQESWDEYVAFENCLENVDHEATKSDLDSCLASASNGGGKVLARKHHRRHHHRAHR